MDFLTECEKQTVVQNILNELVDYYNRMAASKNKAKSMMEIIEYLAKNPDVTTRIRQSCLPLRDYTFCGHEVEEKKKKVFKITGVTWN